jgi:hypothetical protein
MLRKVVRRSVLDGGEPSLLDSYRAYLARVGADVATVLTNEGASEAACRMTRASDVWPAIGLARSEEELKALLVAQFECIRRARIPWIRVDSSTYTWPMHGGAYSFLQWFWNG